jgi:hypothetical protein
LEEPAPQPVATPATRPTTGPTTQATTQPVESLGAGTRVDLSLTNASPKEAFDKLEKASHIKVAAQPAELLNQATGTVTIEAKQKLWLDVFLNVSEQTNVFPYFNPSFPGGWQLTMGGDRRLRGQRSVAGPVVTVLHTVAVDSDIQYGAGFPKKSTVTLSCAVASEPKVPTFTIDSGAILDEVTDSDGKTLEAAGREIKQVAFYGNWNRRDVSISFAIPNEAPAKLSVVRGRYYVNVLESTLDLKIKDLLHSEDKTFTLSGLTFTVTRVAAEAGGYMVYLSVPRGGGLDFARMPLGQAPFAPRLDDRPPQEVRMQMNQQRDNNTVITLYVRTELKGDESSKPVVDLTWSGPGTFRKVEVPFIFKDIALPQ